MFETFTDNARRVMALANQEAQRLDHDYLGPEHILLGLLKEPEGVGGRILRARVDIRAVRLEIEKLSGPPGGAPMGKLSETPRTKSLIEYALDESRKRNQTFVGTGHLLLALLRLGDTTATQALRNAGIEPERIANEDFGDFKESCEAMPRHTAPRPIWLRFLRRILGFETY